MKKNTLLILGFAFLLTISLSAQKFQGVAIYQSKTNIDIKLDSSRISSEQQKRFQEMLKKQFEKTYELNFNKTASTYKEQAKLAQPGGGQGGIRVMFAGAGGGDNLYYKDTKNKIYANQNEVFGKNFLIKDVLPKLEWKLEKETKMIGSYLCFKATTTQPMNEMGFRGRPRRGNDKEKDTEKKPKDTIAKTMEVTAWYTPQIPVNHGPKEYWGLPGLILEVSYAKTMLLCTKIVINPKDKKAIVKPTKGKEVTQAVYDKMIKKKMEEMRERFGGKRRKGGGGVHIRIN